MDRKAHLAVEEYRRARQALLDEYPELAGDEPALLDTLEGMTDAADVVALHIRLARDDEAMAHGLDNIIKGLAERLQRYIARASRNRGVALSVMQETGLRKVTMPDFTASVRPTPPKVVVTDVDKIPDSLFRVSRSPDLRAIKEAIESGETVSGAEISNGGESLSIRVK